VADFRCAVLTDPTHAYEADDKPIGGKPLPHREIQPTKGRIARISPNPISVCYKSRTGQSAGSTHQAAAEEMLDGLLN